MKEVYTKMEVHILLNKIIQDIVRNELEFPIDIDEDTYNSPEYQWYTRGELDACSIIRNYQSNI